MMGAPLRTKADVARISPWLLSSAAKPPLRVGLLLDSPVLARFNARIIEDLQASNFVDLALLIYKKSSPVQRAAGPQTTAGRIARRLFDKKLREHTLYELYLRLDQRRKAADSPLDPIDCSSMLSGINSIAVEPISGKFVHRFPLEALERIRAEKLDVLIRFGFNILKGDILIGRTLRSVVLSSRRQ